MKLSVKIILSCLLLTVTTAQAKSDYKEEILQEILSELRGVTGVAGFSLVVIKKGKAVANISSGFVDKNLSKPVTSEHLFRLASVSKVIGATMIADLIQQGKMSPDDRVIKWLPELAEHYQGITVRQLINHTSGIPHYQAIDVCCWSKQYQTAVDSLEVLKNRALLFSPGENYQYSSFAYSVLGALYERVAKKTISEGVRQFISQLSGQKSPKVENVTQRNSLRSNLFEQSHTLPKSKKFDNKSYTTLGGGLTSSAMGLALFGDAVLHNDYLLKETHSLLFTIPNSGISTGNRLYEMGFGWRVGQDFYGNLVYHHSGVTLGGRSFLVLYPELGITLAFLSNTSWTAQMETNAFSLIQLIFNTKFDFSSPNLLILVGSFDDQSIQAELSCTSASCLFVEHSNVISAWLNRFNQASNRKSADAQRSWSAYKTTNGIALITSIGVVYLKYEQGQWIGKIGSQRNIILSSEKP